jgi:hypothetical protein
MDLNFNGLMSGAAEAAFKPASIEPQHGLEREQNRRRMVAEIYEKHQQNTLITEQLRSELIKGIAQGEDTAGLFLKAMKCISLMTGDTVAYTQTAADIKRIYGVEL